MMDKTSWMHHVRWYEICVYMFSSQNVKGINCNMKLQRYLNDSGGKKLVYFRNGYKHRQETTL
jgi:hypothetical protein